MTGEVGWRVLLRMSVPFERVGCSSRQAGEPGESIRPCDISQGANNEHRRRNPQHPHNACSYRRPAERRIQSAGARLDARAIASLVERRMGCFGRSLRLYLESNLCQMSERMRTQARAKRKRDSAQPQEKGAAINYKEDRCLNS